MRARVHTRGHKRDPPACPGPPARSDRPECELVPNGTRRHDSRYPQSGALVNCNLRFGDEGMTRMLNYVDQAMLRWAARQGRWDVVRPLQEQRAAELGGAAGAAAEAPAGHSRRRRRHGAVLKRGREGAAAASAEDS